ncbi:MAG: NAD(P)/FAD-dependent oxidoreductase [Nitrospirota bacterium]
MDYDVIIAGAGPAGSTCARICAKAGLRTLLLERETFPRPKPCGGALSGRALSHLGLSLPSDLIERECFGVRVHFGKHTVEARKDVPIAVMVNREKFDHYLAQQAVEAGAGLHEGEPVRGFSVQGDRVAVETEQGRYEARCLVGADGAYSVVGRTVRPLFPRDEIFAALVGSHPADDREIAQRSDSLLELFFGVTPMGYGWVFPHKGYYGVGVMCRAAEFDAPQKVFNSFSASTGMPIEKPRGHTIPMGGIDRPVTGRRTILVGDAAGFADPFHGEGMAGAILSGKLAGQAIVDGIGGKKDPLTWYAAECDRLIVREMRIALQMARMLNRYPKLFLAVFFSDRTALDKYLDIPAGRSDYRHFRTWLLKKLPGYIAKMLLGTASART